MKVLAATVVLLMAASSACPEPPMLRPSEQVYAGSTPLNPGGQAIPCFIDWNGDRLPDLLVGHQPASKIAVYYNSGNPTQPLFTTSSNLQAGGVDIHLPSGACGAPAPWVCDYDGDGLRDLLAGAGADGKVWFYRNTNSDSSPILAGGAALLKSGAELSVGARATPCIYDWDHDALPDLLCGDGNGNVHFFRNVGTRQAPVYMNDVLLQAGGSTLSLGYRSAIRIYDWDGDGIKDLVGSGSDNVAWCKNTGSDSSPVLAGPVRLICPNSAGALTNIDTGYRMRLDVVDWNQDGVSDLLMGNWDGTLYLYEGYHFLLTERLLRPWDRHVLAWNSARFLKYHVLAGPTPSQVLEPVATNLLSSGKLSSWTNDVSSPSHFFRVQVAQ